MKKGVKIQEREERCKQGIPFALSLFSFLFSLFFLVALAQEAPPPESGPQEGMIPEEEQQQRWSKAFQEAEAAFNSETQSSSIPVFQDLITLITEQRMKRKLSDPEFLLLLRSLDFLGQAFFNDGQQEQARIVFLKLIELNPNYRMNEDLVSPKIITFVSNIRDENLGTVSISSDPDGATVKLDGLQVGTTNIASMYSLKGDHDLEVSKPGYVPQTKTITVIPKKTQKIAIQLERSSSVGYFITYPRGIELLLGGRSLGTTGGNAAERAQRTATEQNLAFADFSAEFPVPELQPGIYEIEFRKPCWETQYRRITIEKNDDYPFEPIVLSPSPAYLNITADDPQANIFIDNEYIGIVPKQKLQICSGKRVLKLKGPRGKYEKQLQIKKGEVLTINARLNPSLAFVGLIATPDVLKTDLDKLTVEIVQQLSGLQNLNFVDNSGGSDRALLEENLRHIIDGILSNNPDKERRAKIQEISTKVESDLLLVGYVQKERLQRMVQFFLLSNWSSMADFRVVQVFDAEQWKVFKSQLDYEEPLFRKRLGVNLIDTTITPGPVVAQVLLKTYDDSQPLSPGDIITAINGAPVKTAAEALAAIQELQSRDQIGLTLQRSGTQNTVTITMVNSPMEIRFDNPALLFNRQLVAFKKAVNLTTTPLDKNIALLNIGLCHMHFAEYDVAFDQLRQIQLDRTLGIGQGTVLYRTAQCYRELGYRKEAQETLADALRYAKNTIYSDDGPSLVREIERAQLALQ